MLLFAAPLPGYAAAVADAILHSWHSIAYNNEMTLLLSHRRPDNRTVLLRREFHTYAELSN